MGGAELSRGGGGGGGDPWEMMNYREWRSMGGAEL